MSVVGKRVQYIDSGIVRTSPADSHINRLQHIGSELRKVTSALSPDLICVERVFVNVNPSTSLLLGEARGAAIMALLSSDATPIVEISALQVKQLITGQGRASKKQVAMMVGNLLGITVEGFRHDCTDALACALAGKTGAFGQQASMVRRRRKARRWTL